MIYLHTLLVIPHQHGYSMNKKQKDFIDTVLTFHHQNGRHALPWRQTTDPYCILVSELMLQQTQVERVIPKYESFIKKWPTLKHLSKSTLANVLQEWQGLGYNRRAKFLWECSQVVVQEHNSIFPHSYESIRSLPGIGPYTAGAIMAFAYNIPVPIIETNIRTVYIHHFFPHTKKVSDDDILKLIKVTLPEDNVRQWYAALMDYGSYLKKSVANRNSQSRSYVKQSTFKNSNRQIRGEIIRMLTTAGALSKKELTSKLHVFTRERVEEQIRKLNDEGLLVIKRTKVQLPD